ncbi:hypothetical protein RintRC_3837 [Richelia intracellularis]|nr:hypothetical protein RintRC_3837 [Richelia intracellularis]
MVSNTSSSRTYATPFSISFTTTGIKTDFGFLTGIADNTQGRAC